ncbi:MAG: methyl-accepting chemotaxis protein, partial [Deltaproteobacteria bacterium]|nr:methyl-accepting chemotaxis protein [Deltaproteobacteria bacterium]
MKVTRYKNWKIRNKIMFITVLSVILMLGGLFSFLLPKLETKITKEKQDATRHVIETAMAVLEVEDGLVKSGKQSLEEAQLKAADIISKMRYEKKEYIWINDLRKPYPKMIMHPTLPALNGKVLDDAKFNKATAMIEGTDGKETPLNGKNLFVAFAEVVEKAGHGFVNYEWHKPKEGGGTSSELYPKLSYVKKFEPWGWVVGSGIYIDDVQKDISKVRWMFLALNGLMALVSLLLAYFVSRGITRTLGYVDTNLD